MEIDVRNGQTATVTAIRFHNAASIVEKNATTLSVVDNVGGELVAIPKTTVDDFVEALTQSKIIWP